MLLTLFHALVFKVCLDTCRPGSKGSLGDPSMLESRMRLGRRPLSLERAPDGAVGVRRNRTGNMVSKDAQA